MKLEELAFDPDTKFETTPLAEQKPEKQEVPREPIALPLPPYARRPIGFLPAVAAVEGVGPDGEAYHVVPVIDEDLGCIVRRRMYADGHLGAIEEF